MKINAGIRRGLLVAWALSLANPGGVSAHGMMPADMASLSPGQVIAVMESDFLVPDGFGRLPGPLFYLGHKKTLGLSRDQIRKIRKIARTIMPATVRQGKAIEALKRRVVRLSDGRRPLREEELRRLLDRIGRMESRADLDHILAHRACLDLLTPGQRIRLFSLLPSP